MSKKIFFISFIPVLIFLTVGSLLFFGLSKNDVLPSNLIGESATKLPETFLIGYEPIPKNAMIEQKIKIINFWASWCAPCRAEHPNIQKLADMGIKVYGINLKDNSSSAIKFLTKLGNPYDGIGTDKNGKTAIDWGVYGVPETFILDKKGKILYRHPGPITKKVLNKKIIPIILSHQ
ncbi:MAG: DsbE family thiol:disulfide interchange protein [Rhodobacterales bacterium]